MDELGTNPDFGSSYDFIAFAELDSVLAYERARPRKHNGSWVINETPNLTLEEALNERAALNGMPPVGTKISGCGGLEWLIHDYNFIGAPTTVARYPDECEFLPFVAPLNPSERLLQFIGEVDRATSNQIVFLNTMPQIHPFDLGHGIHFTSPTDQSGLAPVYLDVEQAHETIIAHELAHLLVSYMYGTADARELKSKGDHGRKNQLDFLQSFVWDLEVNDLIEKRGFDMSLINTDQINGMRALRDVTLLGYKPPTAREALLHSLFIAGAMLEKKRWSDETVSRGEPLLEFFQTATPDIYGLAVAFVEVINRHGYGRPVGIAASLRECIEIGYRATGDDFDYDRDLKPATAHECMSDKNPAHLPGLPVQLKLEIARTLSRHDITGIVKIWLGASASCQAMIMVEAPGWRAGPLPVNYPLVPEFILSSVSPSNPGHGKAPLAGRTPDKFGRLPGDAGYNTCFPPGQNTMERVQSLVARANCTSGPPMPTGLPDAGFSLPSQLNPPLGTNTQQTRRPKERGTGLPYSIADNNASPGIPFPMVPNPQGNETIHRYMAGLGLSVARTRLKQYQSANPYSYADGNPTNRIDPSGLISQHALGTMIDKANRSLADEDPAHLVARLRRGYRNLDPVIAEAVVHQILRQRDKLLSSSDYALLQRLYDPRDWAVTKAAVPTVHDINVAVQAIKGKIRSEGHTPAIRAALWAISQLGSPRWANDVPTNLPGGWHPIAPGDKCAPFVCDAYFEGARVPMEPEAESLLKSLAKTMTGRNGLQAFTTNEYADVTNQIAHTKVIGIYSNQALQSMSADPGVMIFFPEVPGIGHSVMSLGGQLVINWGTHKGGATIAIATLRGAVAAHSSGTFRIWTDEN
jgi:hypothetical protein